MMPNMRISLLSAASLICAFLPPYVSAQSATQSPTASARNAALAQSIVRLYDADQALLADLAKAKQDPAFRQTYKTYVAQVQAEQHLMNFYDPQVYAFWARDPAAPAIVHRAVAFRAATDAQLRALVARGGWPQRADVGDAAAAGFFFLFGHADDDNDWRLTQVRTIERVFHEDHLNPRLYAHMRDRLLDMAGKPQLFGSIMGPDKAAGSAKLYAPLVDDVQAADARRAAIGLPSVETDLETFRQGAEIGPYMTPMTKGMSWTLADVYRTPAKAGGD